MTEALTIPGARVLPSDIGPVMPVVDIADMIGYSRSAITKAIKDHERKMSPCKTFLPLPTPGGNQQFLCLNRTGVDYLLLFIHPSKTRMGDEEYIDFRQNLLNRMGAGQEEIAPVQQPAQELDEVVAYDLIEARQIATLTDTDPKVMQAAILRKHGYSELADVMTPSVVHGESGWFKPGALAVSCGLTTEQFNNWLQNNPKDPARRPFQYKDGNRIWRLTPLGLEHGQEYTYTVEFTGHKETRIKWRESILYASGLKRPLAENQTALPARAGVQG